MNNRKNKDQILAPEILAMAEVSASILHILNVNGIYSRKRSVCFLEDLAYVYLDQEKYKQDNFKAYLAIYFIIRELEMLDEANLTLEISIGATKH